MALNQLVTSDGLNLVSSLGNNLFVVGISDDISLKEKQPTGIKFFIPTTIENFDSAAEPTLEGITGEDYLGNAIASGGQAINAIDNNNRRTFHINTLGVATVFRIDFALARRAKVNFLIIDGHNLGSVYPGTIEDTIGIYHNSLDDYGSATELTPVDTFERFWDSDRELFLAELPETTDRYWFIQINKSAETGYQENAAIGQVIIGRMFNFNGLVPEAGFDGEYGYPGLFVDESGSGIKIAEEKYGLRNSKIIGFQLSTQAQFENMQLMQDIVKGSLYPFHMSFDYDQANPIFWKTRLKGGLEWDYKHGLAQPWLPSLELMTEIN